MIAVIGRRSNIKMEKVFSYYHGSVVLIIGCVSLWTYNVINEHIEHVIPHGYCTLHVT